VKRSNTKTYSAPIPEQLRKSDSLEKSKKDRRTALVDAIQLKLAAVIHEIPIE